MHKPIGGIKVVYEYANHLSERGHEVNIIHPLLLFPDESYLSSKLGMLARLVGNSVFGIPRLNWFDIHKKVNIITVPSLEERYFPKGDVVIATSWHTAEKVCSYGDDKGRKFYLIQHLEVWSGEEKRVLETWKLPLKKIVISRWLEEVAHQMGEVDVTYIPNGINFNHFRMTISIANRNPKKVGMLYSRIEWKGSEDGIQALNIARSKVPDLEVIFFWSGYPISPKKPKIPSWVELFRNPPQSVLAKLYNSCAIFIHSSWFEGWPLPPAEALACGCALVTTDSKGVRDYAIPDRTALVSEPKNARDLAKNLIELLNDQSMRIRLATEGNRYVQRFTWDKAVKKFEELITQE